MLNIKDLERRWLKYKIKSYAPYTLGGVLAISIVAGAVFWLRSPSDTGIKPPKPTVQQSVSSQPKNLSVAEENATVLEPSMEFVQNFQNDAQVLGTPPASVANARSSVSLSSSAPAQLNISALSQTSPAAPARTYSKGTNKSLSIKRNDSKLDIAELQQRFKETSNANLGLFIARYYYDNEDYVEAYNYALKTNSINNRIDESWILFSKSLVKLGKTEQAKKTLQLYIQQSNSENAKGLLESIEKGTFK